MFDLAIDRAVREMLDVDPPAGLRGRVIARLPVASAFRRKQLLRRKDLFRRKAWMLVPIAAASVILIALLLPRGAPKIVHEAPPVVAGTQSLPAAGPAMSPAVTRPRAGIRAAVGTGRRIQPGQVTAAVAEEPAQGARVAALGDVAPIAVTTIETPAPTTLAGVDVAPIRIAPISVNALPDTPHERQQQE